MELFLSENLPYILGVIQKFLEKNWLDMLGAFIGLIYIYQEYKASIWLWITSIIMPVVYIFVYLDAKLYADLGLQVYYILASVYGLIVWMFGKKHGEQEEIKILHVKRRVVLLSSALFVIGWGGLYFILSRLTDSPVPVADAFGNSLSIIGLWWLSRKYIEQWFLWIVVDTELSVLYVYKGIPFTAGLYALYVIIAIAGYFKWKKMMNESFVKE